jgi:hypothetical protein
MLLCFKYLWITDQNGRERDPPVEAELVALMTRASRASVGAPVSAALENPAIRAGLRLAGAVGRAAIESGAWKADRHNRSRSRCSDDLALSRRGCPRFMREGIVRMKLRSPGINSTLHWEHGVGIVMSGKTGGNLIQEKAGIQYRKEAEAGMKCTMNWEERGREERGGEILYRREGGSDTGGST